MRSMWVSAVLGVMASRCPTWRVEAPRAIRVRTSTSRGVEPAGAHLSAQLACRLLRSHRWAVRAWLGHGPKRARGGEEAAGERYRHPADPPVIPGAIAAFVGH